MVKVKALKWVKVYGRLGTFWRADNPFNRAIPLEATSDSERVLKEEHYRFKVGEILEEE